MHEKGQTIFESLVFQTADPNLEDQLHIIRIQLTKKHVKARTGSHHSLIPLIFVVCIIHNNRLPSQFHAFPKPLIVWLLIFLDSQIHLA